MKWLEVETLSSRDKRQLFELWNTEYPVNVAHESFEMLDEYLQSLKDPKHTLLFDHDDQLKGWFVVFYREGKLWFAMIIDSGMQGQKIGTSLLSKAKSEYPELYGWVVDHSKYKRVNGYIYRSPIDFYLKNGFQIIKNSRHEEDDLSVIKIYWSGQKMDN